MSLLNSICLFCTYSPDPWIPYYVKYYARELANVFDRVIMLSNERDLPKSDLQELSTNGIELKLLPNLGHDFGMYYRHREKWDEAAEQFRKSTERGAPRYFQHMLPGVLERAGKKREALAEWRAVLERMPDDAVAKRHIEDLESQLGED